MLVTLNGSDAKNISPIPMTVRADEELTAIPSGTTLEMQPSCGQIRPTVRSERVQHDSACSRPQ
jgi:hypothetical protein